MKKIVFAILASLILAFEFSGCSGGIKEGTVYRKSFVEKHTETIMIPIVHSTRESCSTTIVPMIRTYPNEWIISIKKYNSASSEWETKNFYVKEEIYKKVEIGDYYILKEKDGTTDEPYTQEELK